MKTAIRNAAFAFAAAASLVPAAARACEPEPPQPAVHFEVHGAPGPVNAQWNDRDDRGRDWDRDGRDGGRWERERHERWEHERALHERMERERAELRAAYAQLDVARDRFYAFPHRPWRVRQFEAWYAGQRAALDARRQGVVAWR